MRYFMTIPEAAQLVLEAGAMGERDEFLVLGSQFLVIGARRRDGLLAVWCPRVGDGGFGMSHVQPRRLRCKPDRSPCSAAVPAAGVPGMGFPNLGPPSSSSAFGLLITYVS